MSLGDHSDGGDSAGGTDGSGGGHAACNIGDDGGDGGNGTSSNGSVGSTSTRGNCCYSLVFTPLIKPQRSQMRAAQTSKDPRRPEEDPGETQEWPREGPGEPKRDPRRAKSNALQKCARRAGEKPTFPEKGTTQARERRFCIC